MFYISCCLVSVRSYVHKMRRQTFSKSHRPTNVARSISSPLALPSLLLSTSLMYAFVNVNSHHEQQRCGLNHVSCHFVLCFKCSTERRDNSFKISAFLAGRSTYAFSHSSPKLSVLERKRKAIIAVASTLVCRTHSVFISHLRQRKDCVGRF